MGPPPNAKQQASSTAHKLFVIASSDKDAGCANEGKQLNKQGVGNDGLSNVRSASSIPNVPGSGPESQAGAEGVWMYPSEQQFFDAMKKKGWDPHKADMQTVVAIHNTVNERAWREVVNWERMHKADCSTPRLKRFRGRPNEYSPKARLLNFLGYKLPFDRHDWIVDRCGCEVRYIIDFYNAATQPDKQVALHLDVRPALDSFGSLWDRLRMQSRWVGSGRWIYE